ncbi:Holliday junction branch migration DNA helicase RuvB [Engelhardtia mirabilis]|uniref:Holliday junction branch migration complex subunit RuvB n=1 Tax=Engelhardtia mirabilis TaxID=2528011 RepID=A0A518BJ98_9BACT|nr:Holliday junction ATP-dependent DNA helicase RuvB [Planctomycetes bacterium Pla133]QDV01373.1 Holliday junction ATP-dependent DNA helicase RuvB [Planctomycetes bacterium Pla86]
MSQSRGTEDGGHRREWTPAPAAGSAGEATSPPEGHWTDPATLLGEGEEDFGLRPRSLDEFVGQRRAVENLRVALQAAKGRGESPDHLLLAGPPGLGKTSLARILAAELGTHLHATSGPALERPKDLVGILTQLQRGDLLFIDEIHRVPAGVEEYLYGAMEDFRVEFTLNEGPHARVIPLTVERFTLVGATTREGLLSSPFRARFGLLERLDPYPTEDLVRILERSARLLGVELEPDAATLLASRARGTPRVANRFLRRVRDLGQVRQERRLSATLADETMTRIGVDAHGLEELDRRILHVLARNGSTPIGLKTLAAAVGEAEDTIEDVFEPHLLRLGFLHRTARGRVATADGCRAIGVEPDTQAPGSGGTASP